MRRILQLAITLCLWLPFVPASAQDNKLKSMDGEFVMEVVRENTAVKITFYFTDPTKYAHLDIEREQSDGQFRQCAYIDLKSNYGGALEALDNYPSSNLRDSYYRVRTVTTDQIERIYPPVRLPAITQVADTTHAK